MIPYNIFFINLDKYMNYPVITLENLMAYINFSMYYETGCPFCRMTARESFKWYTEPNKVLIFKINNPNNIRFCFNRESDIKIQVEYQVAENVQKQTTEKREYYLRAAIFYNRIDNFYYCACLKRNENEKGEWIKFINEKSIKIQNLDEIYPNQNQDDLVFIIFEKSKNLGLGQFNTNETEVEDTTYFGGSGIYEATQRNEQLNNYAFNIQNQKINQNFGQNIVQGNGIFNNNQGNYQNNNIYQRNENNNNNQMNLMGHNINIGGGMNDQNKNFIQNFTNDNNFNNQQRYSQNQGFPEGPYNIDINNMNNYNQQMKRENFQYGKTLINLDVGNNNNENRNIYHPFNQSQGILNTMNSKEINKNNLNMGGQINNAGAVYNFSCHPDLAKSSQNK